MSELDPVNDALERLEWQDAREDAPERSAARRVLAAHSADRRRGRPGQHDDRRVRRRRQQAGLEQGAERHPRQRHLQDLGGAQVRVGQPRDDEPVLRADHATAPRTPASCSGCSYQFTGSKNSNVNEMVNAFNTAITGGADGIAVLPRRQEGVQPAHRRGAEGQDPGPRLQRGRAEQRAAGLHRPGPVRLRRGDGQADPGSRPLGRRRAVHRHARAVQHPAADRRRPQRPQEGLGHQAARDHHGRRAAGGAVGHRRVRAEPPRDQGLLRRRRRQHAGPRADDPEAEAARQGRQGRRLRPHAGHAEAAGRRPDRLHDRSAALPAGLLPDHAAVPRPGRRRRCRASPTPTRA